MRQALEAEETHQLLSMEPSPGIIGSPRRASSTRTHPPDTPRRKSMAVTAPKARKLMGWARYATRR